MDIAKLEGALLDYWVAKAEGHSAPLILKTKDYGQQPYIEQHWCAIDVSPAGHVVYAPSTGWSQGGSIIDREFILLDASYISNWFARCGRGTGFGPTPLIAAMRAYVASKFGKTVEDI